MNITNQELQTRVQLEISPKPKTRSIPFLVGIGLFGLGLASMLTILDPFIYTEKVRLLAPPSLKNTALSFITITTLLVALVVQPLVGRWSDHSRSRWGRRAPFLMGGVLGLTLALTLVVAATDLWLLIVAVICVSASSNTLQGSWQALVPDRVPVSQHGTMAGIKTLLESIGVVVGITLVGITVAQGTLWIAPLVVGGFLWLILGITLSTLRQTPPVSLSTRRANFQSNDEGIFRQLQKINFSHLPPAFPWWMLNRFLFWVAIIGVRTFLLNYMEDVLNLSLAEAEALSSRITLLLGGGVILLVIPAGAVADRIGRRPLLIMAGLLAATGALFFIFLRDLNLLFMAGGLIAGGAGIFASASWALATDIVPKSEGALYLGLANAATVLGSISGRLGGPLIDGVNHLSGTTTLGYLVVFGLAVLFFAGSSLAVLKIREA